MVIIIHRAHEKDADKAFKYLQNKLYGAVRNKKIKVLKIKAFRNERIININDIHIEIKFGRVTEMANTAPDYYNTDNYTASDFLRKSDTKHKSKELYGIGSVYDTIIMECSKNNKESVAI